MTINILTLFPEMVEDYFNHSMAARAVTNHHIKVNVLNIRDFSTAKHSKVDDMPFGGGAGMLMTPQPLFDSVKHVKNLYAETLVVYLSPRGRTLNNTVAREFATYESILFVCGHYEGVDQRFIDEMVDVELSIGDYVLTGGELASLVAVDAMMRFIPGVLGADNVHDEESFEDSLLEYPQYTRPADYNGLKAPEVLLSGHHANIKKWQRKKQIEITFKRRPDLLEKAQLSKEDLKYFKQLEENH